MILVSKIQWFTPQTHLSSTRRSCHAGHTKRPKAVRPTRPRRTRRTSQVAHESRPNRRHASWKWKRITLLGTKKIGTSKMGLLDLLPCQWTVCVKSHCHRCHLNHSPVGCAAVSERSSIEIAYGFLDQKRKTPHQ